MKTIGGGVSTLWFVFWGARGKQWGGGRVGGTLNPNAAGNKGSLIDDKLGGFIRASRMELDGIVGRQV
jgi:hypothetical protein